MTTKHELPHTDEAKRPDGTFDMDHIKENLGKGLANIDNGHEKLTKFDQEVSPGGGRRYIVDIDPA